MVEKRVHQTGQMEWEMENATNEVETHHNAAKAHHTRCTFSILVGAEKRTTGMHAKGFSAIITSS